MDMLTPIEEWCRKHIGEVLPVVCTKDFGMVELWDDRCVQVIPNTGKRATENGVMIDAWDGDRGWQPFPLELLEVIT